MLGEITVNDVEENNVTIEDDLETNAKEIVSENKSLINLNVLLFFGLSVIILVYLRTRIDDISKI
jgi:hypothetical protein